MLILVGMTPMHLAMESGHGAIAVQLIEAGADRERVNLLFERDSLCDRDD